MEYLYLALLLLAAFIPAGYLLLRTNQVKKRGCGGAVPPAGTGSSATAVSCG